MTAPDGSRKQGRGESLSSAEDDRSSGRKRNDRPGNPADHSVTTGRIRGAFQFSDPIRGQLEFARLIEDADASNIAEIREMFDEFNRSGLTYDAQWRMFWHQWGAIDPQAALAKITSEVGKNGEGYTADCHGWIFSAWSASDPAGAISALATIKSKEGYEAAYRGLVSGMTLAEATRFAEASEFNDPRFASAIGENLADRKLRETNSITDLKSWYGELDPSIQVPALDHVYWRIRTVDFNDAAAWIKSQAEAGAPTQRIAAEMTDEFLRRDDLSGLNWYLSLPTSSQDPGKIGEWANRIDPNSPSYRSWAADHADASRLLESRRKSPEESSH
ncbi:MAG: hypothetical protein ABIS50_17700 [Luteolibacter sp.]|uniref:hypothetical protein n=1 Tax=Luteolibacter sp. TaxID=1962973 RepID=UPI00326649E7